MPQLFSREWLNTFYHTGARAVKQSEPRATDRPRAVFRRRDAEIFSRGRKTAARAPKKIPRARSPLRRARSKEFDSAETRARILEPSMKFRARWGTRAGREREQGEAFTIL